MVEGGVKDPSRIWFRSQIRYFTRPGIRDQGPGIRDQGPGISDLKSVNRDGDY